MRLMGKNKSNLYASHSIFFLVPLLKHILLLLLFCTWICRADDALFQSRWKRDGIVAMARTQYWYEGEKTRSEQEMESEQTISQINPS